MKSTGETIGLGDSYEEAMHNALSDSYHLTAPIGEQTALVDEASAQDTSLMNLLNQINIDIQVIAANETPTINPSNVWLVINSETEQTTTTKLNYFALSNGIPFFSATETLKGILTSQSAEAHGLRPVCKSTMLINRGLGD